MQAKPQVKSNSELVENDVPEKVQKAKFSLRNFDQLKQKVKQDHIEESARMEAAEKVSIPFDGFKKIWNEFAANAKVLGKQSLHMLMTANEPTMTGPNEFRTVVATETLKETFSTEKMALVDKIAEAFNTNKFEITVIVQETAEDDKLKFLSTPKEKYDHMVQINPELKNLMDELGLDFNF